MNGPLFFAKPTSHRVMVDNKPRVMVDNKPRVVFARYDWEDRFVRFVVQRTKAEVEKKRKRYLPARVGICDWFEVRKHNFITK